LFIVGLSEISCMSPGGATLKYELRRLEKENEANRHVQISEHKGVEVSQKCIKNPRDTGSRMH